MPTTTRTVGRSASAPALLLRAMALAAALAASLAACASGGGGGSAGAAPEPGTSGSGQPATEWPMRTREHVDLWLHGFALVQSDTTQVPYFRRGYRTEVLAEKRRLNVSTIIDANADRLQARFLAYPNLVSAQFLALYFGTWDQMREAFDLFLRAEGQPQASNDPQVQQIIATFATYFPTAQDREWARIFVQGLEDERTKYWSAYWRSKQQQGASAVAAADQLWQQTYLPKFLGYLRNTRQGRGEVLLSVPLDGEGRTISVGALNLIAVSFPAGTGDARDPIYVLAHEIAGAVTNPAIRDNITPAEQRSGVGDRYAASALVHGGAMLIQKVAPDLLEGYIRYYLASANARVTAPTMASLAATFPLPENLRTAIARQLDVVLGGI